MEEELRSARNMTEDVDLSVIFLVLRSFWSSGGIVTIIV